MRSLWFALFLLACDDGEGSSGPDPDAARSDGETDVAVVDAALDATPSDGAPPEDATPPDAAPDAAPDNRPAKWRLICGACHGQQGEGGDLGYELRHPVRDYGEYIVRNGRFGGDFPVVMAAYEEAQISSAELEEIWDWLDTFPRAETGEGLYLDHCASCHGETGRGGPTGVRLIGEAHEVRQRVRAGENVRAYGQRGSYMPAFNTTQITDAELALIEDFVDSL